MHGAQMIIAQSSYRSVTDANVHTDSAGDEAWATRGGSTPSDDADSSHHRGVKPRPADAHDHSGARKAAPKPRAGHQLIERCTAMFAAATPRIRVARRRRFGGCGVSQTIVRCAVGEIEADKSCTSLDVHRRL
jgi:hypothetical protein